jgi:hypothetical protein
MRKVERLLPPGGLFLIWEPTCFEGEDREGWMERFRQMRPQWPAISDEEFAAFESHHRASDFAETALTWRAIAREAGFEQAEEIFTAPNQFARVYLFLPLILEVNDVAVQGRRATMLGPLYGPSPPIFFSSCRSSSAFLLESKNWLSMSRNGEPDTRIRHRRRTNATRDRQPYARVLARQAYFRARACVLTATRVRDWPSLREVVGH